jgi:hypothetical protein
MNTRERKTERFLADRACLLRGSARGFWAKDERRTTLDLLSGLTHEHLYRRATNEHRRTRTEKQTNWSRKRGSKNR